VRGGLLERDVPSRFAERILDTARYRLDASGGEKFHAAFAESEYVKFPGFISPDGVELLREEVRRLGAVARRRDFRMVSMANSPRHMLTIGGKGIAETSDLVPALYRYPALLDFVTGVFGEPATLVDDPTERHVINILEAVGDTHGAHFDDFPLALVMFLETPPHGAGGELEFVRAAASLNDLEAGRVRRVRHEPGDAYLLKADTAAHRVVPLSRPAVRVAMNMAYTRPGATHATTRTASLLYD
jgi:hypothetical protein